jgi:2-dehydropantoate 2-reductase
MKILIFGRGVVGSIYAWALEKAGHSVEFYVRPGRAAQYGSSLKLDLLDARTRVQGVRVNETMPMRFVEDLPVNHDYDFILVSVQHHRFPEVVAFLSQRVGNATVLVLNNFWTDPRLEAAALPADQLVWGFPRAGGDFRTDGTLYGSLFSGVTIGTFSDAADTGPTQREMAVRAMFKQSGFPILEQSDFQGWLWLHFLENAGLLAQSLPAGSFLKVVQSSHHLHEAILNVRELLPLLAARGVDLKLHTSALVMFRIPPRLTAPILKLVFRFHAPAKRIAQDNPGETKEELRHLLYAVLNEARRLGITLPRLEALAAGDGAQLNAREVREQPV